MGPLVIIIVIELVFTTGIVVFPHKIANVLGTQKLAQVDDNVAPAPADTPATDTNSQPASDNSPPPPSAPADSTSPESSPNSAPAPADQTSTTPTADSTPAPAAATPESPSNPQAPAEPNASPNPAETSSGQTQAVLSPDDLINSPENISNKSIDEAKKEEDKLSQTTNLAEQTGLLINFATDKVRDMSNFTKSDDFASTNFAAQRFNDQIDQAISNLDKLPPKQQASFRKQMVNFCDQADKVLRTVALSVPEESEQDLQIARGQCQELNL